VKGGEDRRFCRPQGGAPEQCSEAGDGGDSLAEYLFPLHGSRESGMVSELREAGI
jgi:hypothetical protein